jgi:hypothetical protein
MKFFLIEDDGAEFDWPAITRKLTDTIPWQVEASLKQSLDRTLVCFNPVCSVELRKLTGSNERLSNKFRDVPAYPWNLSTSYAPRCDAGPPSFISFKSSRSEKRPAGRHIGFAPNEQG